MPSVEVNWVTYSQLDLESVNFDPFFDTSSFDLGNIFILSQINMALLQKLLCNSFHLANDMANCTAFLPHVNFSLFFYTFSL